MESESINTAGTTVHIQNVEHPDEIIRLEHLPPGIYFFRPEKDGKTMRVRVVKN